jgi:hypothetical protein
MPWKPSVQPVQQVQSAGATLGPRISLGLDRKSSGRIRPSTRDSREEARLLAPFHEIPLGRLVFGREEETSRRESLQLGRNTVKEKTD